MIDRSLPACGKVKVVGTIELGSSATCGDGSMCRRISVEHASTSAGSTTSRSPTRNAVRSASRASPSICFALMGVSTDTSPGRTHSASSSAKAT